MIVLKRIYAVYHNYGMNILARPRIKTLIDATYLGMMDGYGKMVGVCEYSKQSNIRLDSIIRIANFRTCEYSNVSNYIPKKSGKNRNPRKSEKKSRKILRNLPPKNPNVSADS